MLILTRPQRLPQQAGSVDAPDDQTPMSKSLTRTAEQRLSLVNRRSADSLLAITLIPGSANQLLGTH